MDKKKSIILYVSIGIVFVALSVLVCFRLFGGFNAKEYVNSVFVQQQEDMVNYLVDNVIASGLTLEEEQRQQCIKITENIFSKLEYEVTKSTKVKDGEYHVTITYKKTDVMKKLQELAKQENEIVREKANKGDPEYRGTGEEIDAKMRKEFAEKIPEMLEEAYKTMESGKQETMTLTVKKQENGLYTVDIGKFLIKIMDLSAKQD